MVMYMTNVADVPNWLLLLQQAGFEGEACMNHDSKHDSKVLKDALQCFQTCVLYLWEKNYGITCVQCTRAGSHKFPQIFSMHRARGARPRGSDSLPSLSDVGTVSF